MPCFFRSSSVPFLLLSLCSLSCEEYHEPNLIYSLFLFLSFPLVLFIQCRSRRSFNPFNPTLTDHIPRSVWLIFSFIHSTPLYIPHLFHIPVLLADFVLSCRCRITLAHSPSLFPTSTPFSHPHYSFRGQSPPNSILSRFLPTQDYFWVDNC